MSELLSNFQFEPMNFIDNLQYMGTGMLCIMIVIGVIIGIVTLLEKVTSRKSSKEENDQ